MERVTLMEKALCLAHAREQRLQRELEEAVSVGLSPEVAGLESLVPEGAVLVALCPEGAAGSLQMDPGGKTLLEGVDRMPPSCAGSVNGDVLMAVQYRISMKRCLEGALQAVLSRTRGEGHAGVEGVQKRCLGPVVGGMLIAERGE